MKAIILKDAINILDSKKLSPSELGLKQVCFNTDPKSSNIWAISESETELPLYGIGGHSVENRAKLIALLEQFYGVSFDTPISEPFVTCCDEEVATFGDLFSKTYTARYKVWREWLESNTIY